MLITKATWNSCIKRCGSPCCLMYFNTAFIKTSDLWRKGLTRNPQDKAMHTGSLYNLLFTLIIKIQLLENKFIRSRFYWSVLVQDAEPWVTLVPPVGQKALRCIFFKSTCMNETFFIIKSSSRAETVCLRTSLSSISCRVTYVCGQSDGVWL